MTFKTSDSNSGLPAFKEKFIIYAIYLQLERLHITPQSSAHASIVKCKAELQKSAYPQNQSVHEFVDTGPFQFRPSTVLHQFGL